MKALLLDIGNSRLKWGVLGKDRINRTGHVSQSAIQEHGFAALTSKLPRDVDTVLACNVAGAQQATRIARAIASHCGCGVKFVRSESQACGVTNSYRQPWRMGVDRWVAMIAARAACDTSSIVVDAGTAITIDALDDDGKHLGGQIMPGITLMSEALARHTSDIPQVRKRLSGHGLGIFANSTAAAVAHGILGAAVAAVERATRVMREDGYDPTVILTGGDAAYLFGSIDEQALHYPHLVLQGLQRILECRGESSS
ncbi:MAG: type III pantothenate kinase [Gammaproteobacteria bacterium]|nr:type III pantothenate kinase [Gammaproteobacteria bacterium]